jgi:hypothetical protein
MMMGISRKIAVSGIAVATILATSARAEVGVHTTEAQPVGPYQILRIVEDPSPFGSWAPITSSNPNHVVLNPVGEANGDGPPSMLMNPFSGLPTVAWARNSASGYDVVVSHFTSGAWSEPQVVAGSVVDERDPWLALDPLDGTVHLLYWIDGAIPTVMHRQAPADLSSWSPPLQVSDGIQPAYRPAAVFHDGTLRVTFEAHPFGQGQTPREIVMAEKTGPSFLLQVMGISNHDEPLWPQVHSHDDKLWLEWIEDDDEMAWRRLETGGWSVAEHETFQSSEELELFVRGTIRSQAILPQN